MKHTDNTHSVRQASSGGIDNLQAAYNGTQAAHPTSQYPSGGDTANVATASGSAAQSRECSTADQFWEGDGVRINKTAFDRKAKEAESRYAPPVIEGSPSPIVSPQGELQFPPGKAGAIAHLIYHNAPRPVREVAIVSALGLLAGVCGRSWLTPNGDSGLNVYIVLLARSGIGKEAMSSGISMFIKAACHREPPVADFYSFANYASGQALINAVSLNPCFTHVASEFGRKLKQMGNSKDAPMQTLKTEMTNLYSKSGPQSIAGGIVYSDQKNNKEIAGSAAYSMIGDSTPGTFHQSLTDAMMEDGFMSRLTVIEYSGERPRLNKERSNHIPQEVAEWFADLARHSREMRDRDVYTTVMAEAAAEELLDAFDIECDDEINSTDDEARRQMWNRAHLKALRIACLLAAADNYHHPCITTQHAQWTIDLIRRDIAVFTSRLEAGDVGEDDRARESKLLTLMKDYLSKPPSLGYRVPEALRTTGIIQRAYLQKRTASLPAFTSHASGATKALDYTLQSLCQSGYAMKCDRAKMVEAYSEHGDCYRIIKLPQVK